MEKNAVIINKKVSKTSKILEVNGDIIVPDIKPDIKPCKREYGEFKNVLLTDDEYKKIEGINALSQIENLSRYIASTGKRYKSHYATILNWDRRDKQKQEQDKYKGMSYREQEYIRQKKLIWGDDYNG